MLRTKHTANLLTLQIQAVTRHLWSRCADKIKLKLIKVVNFGKPNFYLTLGKPSPKSNKTIIY